MERDRPMARPARPRASSADVGLLPRNAKVVEVYGFVGWITSAVCFSALRARVRACVRACARACVRASVRACVCLRARACVCLYVCVFFQDATDAMLRAP